MSSDVDVNKTHREKLNLFKLVHHTRTCMHNYHDARITQIRCLLTAVVSKLLFYMHKKCSSVKH